jgi:hypothetical protein
MPLAILETPRAAPRLTPEELAPLLIQAQPTTRPMSAFVSAAGGVTARYALANRTTSAVASSEPDAARDP